MKKIIISVLVTIFYAILTFKTFQDLNTNSNIFWFWILFVVSGLACLIVWGLFKVLDIYEERHDEYK